MAMAMAIGRDGSYEMVGPGEEKKGGIGGGDHPPMD